MGFLDDLFGSKKKDVVTTTSSGSTSTTALPEWQRNLVQPQVQKIAGMQGFNPLTQAPRSGAALQAERLASGQAGNTAGLDAASGYNQQVLGGQFMGSNPFLDATYNQAASRLGENFAKYTEPGIGAKLMQAGRLRGNPGAAGTFADARGELGDAMANLGNQIYGGAYNTERSAMEAAAGRAPSLNAAGFEGARVLGNLGVAGDQYGARADTLGAQNQLLPWQVEQMRTALLGGNYGDQMTTTTGNNSTTTPTYGPSLFSQILGGAATVAPMFFGMPPMPGLGSSVSGGGTPGLPASQAQTQALNLFGG